MLVAVSWPVLHAGIWCCLCRPLDTVPKRAGTADHGLQALILLRLPSGRQHWHVLAAGPANGVPIASSASVG